MNLNQTFSITFWLNKAKTNKQGLTPIWLRITINSKRAECSVQKFVHVKHWDMEHNRVRSGCSDANSINDYLDLVRAEVLRHYNILLTTRDVVTADDVKNSYKGVKEIKKTFFQLFDQYMQHLILIAKKSMIYPKVGISDSKSYLTNAEIL